MLAKKVAHIYDQTMDIPSLEKLRNTVYALDFFSWEAACHMPLCRRYIVDAVITKSYNLSCPENGIFPVTTGECQVQFLQ